MDFATSPRWRALPAVAAILASGALLFFGTGLQPVWWLAWLAPWPVLALAMRSSARMAAMASFLGWSIGDANSWSYLASVQVPVVVRVIAIVVPALVFAIATLLARALALRGRIVAAAFAIPALWTSVEYLNSLTSPHGTSLSIAYSQMDALAVIQVAAVCGLWGIVFLVMLFPAAIAVASAPNASKASRIRLIATAGLVVAAGIGYGGLRLYAATTEPARNVRIGLASIQTAPRVPLDEPQGEELLHRYLAVADRLSDAKADFIVLPETTFASTASAIPAFSDYANLRHVAIDVGIDDRSEPGNERNASILFRDDQRPAEEYAKQHLIPGLEARYRPGSVARVLDGTPRIGLAVCKDMDFTATGRTNGRMGARLLLVPAWDFGVDAWLHSRMAILRGVESGFAIARSARDGSLTLSDDRGRVIADAPAVTEGSTATLVGTLPVRDIDTIYAQFGDWFAWLSLVVAAVCILFVLAPARRSDR